MPKKFRYLLLIFWTILIIVLLTIPLPISQEAGVSYADKFVHAILFGVFTYLFYYGFSVNKNTNKNLLIFASIFFGTTYSFLTEIIQSFLPARSSSEADFLAGFFGIFLASLIIYEKYFRNKA